MTKITEEIRQILLAGGTVTAKSPRHKSKRVIVDAFAVKDGEDAGKPYTDLKVRTDEQPQTGGPGPSPPEAPTRPAVPSNIRAPTPSKEEAEEEARAEMHLEGFANKRELIHWAKETYGLKLSDRDTREALESELVEYYVARRTE